MIGRSGSAFSVALAHRVTAKRATSDTTTRMLGALGDLLGDDGVERDPEGVPTAFRIWKAGVNATDHGDHIFSAKSAELLMAQQAERGNRFSFDVDHMSLNDQAPVENHKAVGSHMLEERDGELWACDVKFNPSVRAGVTPQNPEWPYFSPAYDVDTKTGEIVRYINTSLTPNPATHNVTKLASMANHERETAMADEDKKEESLGSMLAAFEAEGDEEKRSAMKDAIRAKFKAAFPDDAGDDKKDDKNDDKKTEKTAKAAEPDGDEKKTAKTAEEPDEKKKEAIAASIADRALSDFETKRVAREEKAELDRILATLPEGERADYEGMSIVQVKRVLARHRGDILTRHAAVMNVSPTRGALANQRESNPDKDTELDRAMGIYEKEPFVREEGSKLIFGATSTSRDAAQMLASIDAEVKKSGPKTTRAAAFTRVLSNMKGGV